VPQRPAASATLPPVKALPERVQVAIVGAGFGGLAMAIRLKASGEEDFVVLERAPEVGGTWYANTYPGCQCDVPSNLYSFSFARNPEWTRSYPLQPQILEYIKGCVRDHGLEPHLHRECEMLGARWSPGEERWIVETSKGTVRARVLIPAPGLLSEPTEPSLPGLERFRGTIFHSAHSNHEHDLTGERVGLVGTGATAVQIAPAIRPRLAKLHVFQRTPPWVLPHVDRPVGRGLRTLYRLVPGLQELARRGVYALREGFVLGMVYRPVLLKLQEGLSRLHMRVQVPDPAMRAKLTPEYAIGCKRIVLSNAWFPALTAPNAELVTDAIAEVREHAIVTSDGTEREIDTLVFATGFTPTDPPIARRIAGAAGRTLSDAWTGSPQAYNATAVAGFPNLFLLYGPNSNLGHSSIIYMLEAQVAYVLDALRVMRERRAAAIEVRPEVQDAYNAKLQERLAGTVWNSGGCGSWYIDAKGRNSIQWPGFTFEFARRTRALDPDDFALTPA